jgi:hypothetical protein
VFVKKQKYLGKNWGIYSYQHKYFVSRVFVVAFATILEQQKKPADLGMT